MKGEVGLTYNSDLMRYYYHYQGKVEGPVELWELNNYVESGVVPRNVSCCEEGSTVWTVFEGLKGLGKGKGMRTPPTLSPMDSQSNSGAASSKIKEYKVLSQKDKWFSQKFDPENLAQALNSYAQQGWRVIAVSTATFPGMFSRNREEIIVILERDK